MQVHDDGDDAKRHKCNTCPVGFLLFNNPVTSCYSLPLMSEGYPQIMETIRLSANLHHQFQISSPAPATAGISWTAAVGCRKGHKRCREVPKQGRWTAEEHEHFLQALGVHGKDWEKVQADVPTRSLSQIRSHAQKHFLSLAKQREFERLVACDPTHFLPHSLSSSSSDNATSSGDSVSGEVDWPVPVDVESLSAQQWQALETLHLMTCHWLQLQRTRNSLLLTQDTTPSRPVITEAGSVDNDEEVDELCQSRRRQRLLSSPSTASHAHSFAISPSSSPLSLAVKRNALNSFNSITLVRDRDEEETDRDSFSIVSEDEDVDEDEDGEEEMGIEDEVEEASTVSGYYLDYII
jgi:SHAQKYF class myb-like DNA-binding protein